MLLFNQDKRRAGCIYFLTLIGLLSALGFGCKKKAPPPAPPPEVQVITVNPTNVPIFEEWIGTLDGFVNATIRAQVAGYLMSQNYAEGSRVKKDDLLFQIDPRPFQAVVDQAQARLAQDQAQLNKTQLDVKRYAPLAKEQAISQQQLDDSVQAELGAEAQVKADGAALETARLNLGFTRITSPVEGLAGIALAQIGDLVSPSSSNLTTVSVVNPIKVYFQVSEQSYLTFWQRLTVDNTNRDLALELILSNGSLYPEKGIFFIVDRQVNPNTGTLQIVGLFTNANYLLRPGQYGRVRAQTQLKTNVLLVPQRAIAEMQGTRQVTVVDDQNKAHVKSVTLSDQVGADWVVEKGLEPGDRVVVEGLQKAKDGAVVAPKPYSPGTSSPPATNSPPPQPRK